MSIPHPTNHRFRDLTGQRFQRLVVIEYVGRNARRNSRWTCRCDCGELTTVVTSALTSGNTTSCGCARREAINRPRKHGACVDGMTPEYRTWANMIQRCTNPKNREYHNYGGRGITVCPEWVASFAAFLSAVGPKPFPRAELDRFPDMNGGYFPGNVRWTTRTQNQRNKRTNVMLEFRGETMPSSAWAERYGMHPTTLESRLRWGWSVERALTTPVNRWKPGRKPRTNRS